MCALWACAIEWKYFAWDDATKKLNADRGIGFEEVVFDIELCDLLDIAHRTILVTSTSKKFTGIQEFAMHTRARRNDDFRRQLLLLGEITRAAVAELPWR
jgi:hypothetical protein